MFLPLGQFHSLVFQILPKNDSPAGGGRVKRLGSSVRMDNRVTSNDTFIILSYANEQRVLLHQIGSGAEIISVSFEEAPRLVLDVSDVIAP